MNEIPTLFDDSEELGDLFDSLEYLLKDDDDSSVTLEQVKSVAEKIMRERKIAYEMLYANQFVFDEETQEWSEN